MINSDKNCINCFNCKIKPFRLKPITKKNANTLDLIMINRFGAKLSKTLTRIYCVVATNSRARCGKNKWGDDYNRLYHADKTGVRVDAFDTQKWQEVAKVCEDYEDE